jgi:type IV secretion system protein VirB10
MGQALPEHPIRVALPREEPQPAQRSVPAHQTETSAVTVPAPLQQHAMRFWEDSSAMQQAAQLAASRAVPSAATGRLDPDVARPGPGSSDYAQRMQTTRFADTAPTPPRFHVQYTLKKGTVFPCTPASPISSGLPGPVQCTVDQDVWSMDGTTILLPRGTQVNGSVEHGLTNGEERLFLVWTDALTPRPDLLAIPLDSPAADEMGLTGVPGDVNDHLWKRIKTALLLSAVDIAGSAVTALAQSGRGNTNLNIGSIGGTASTMGQMAFGRDLNIPATLYRGPGQPLTVYVNHYIDLFRFYQNRLRY